MRKGGTAVIIVEQVIALMKGRGSGTSTETGAILTVNFPRADLPMIEHRRATTGILTVAAHQVPELTKIDQAVIPMVTEITIRTAVINLNFANYGTRVLTRFTSHFKINIRKDILSCF